MKQYLFTSLDQIKEFVDQNPDIFGQRLSHDELVRIEALKVAQKEFPTAQGDPTVAVAAIYEKYIEEGIQE